MEPCIRLAESDGYAAKGAHFYAAIGARSLIGVGIEAIKRLPTWYRTA
jgi:hypothetical protein